MDRTNVALILGQGRGSKDAGTAVGLTKVSDSGRHMSNIYQRIHKVMEKVAYIRKDKKVETYMAVTHDAVTAEVRPLFVENGIVIAPTFVSGQTVLTGTQTAKGTPIIRYEGTYDVRFVNAEEPTDMIVVRVESHANDHGDKAPGKALSYATKYAILKLLMIETGESDEGRVRAEDVGDGIPEMELADLLGSLDEAATLEELQTSTRSALQVAKAGQDVIAHRKIKERGIELSKKFAKNGAEKRATQ